MPYYKKAKPLLWGLLLALFANIALAGGSNLTIKSAELLAVDDAFVLNADVDVKLSPKIEEAISKGFMLNFLIEFQLAKPRKYWFDDEIITVVNEVSLSYHALSRQFLVARNAQQKAFVRLDEALDDLSEISRLKALQKTDIEKDSPYKALLLMRLDAKRLPQSLQGEDEWKLSSQRFEWTPTFIPNESPNPAKPDPNK